MKSGYWPWMPPSEPVAVACDLVAVVCDLVAVAYCPTVAWERAECQTPISHLYCMHRHQTRNSLSIFMSNSRVSRKILALFLAVSRTGSVITPGRFPKQHVSYQHGEVNVLYTHP
jgi:hypothetical protein